MTRLSAITLVLLACTPYTTMDFHREALDPMARGHADCENGPLEVVDETPEDFSYGRDLEARRYQVTACGQQDTYICFRQAEHNVGATAPECRRLGEEPSRVHLGPFPL